MEGEMMGFAPPSAADALAGVNHGATVPAVAGGGASTAIGTGGGSGAIGTGGGTENPLTGQFATALMTARAALREMMRGYAPQQPSGVPQNAQATMARPSGGGLSDALAGALGLGGVGGVGGAEGTPRPTGWGGGQWTPRPAGAASGAVGTGGVPVGGMAAQRYGIVQSGGGYGAPKTASYDYGRLKVTLPGGIDLNDDVAVEGAVSRQNGLIDIINGMGREEEF